jgi:hypothetical protein
VWRESLEKQIEGGDCGRIDRSGSVDNHVIPSWVVQGERSGVKSLRLWEECKLGGLESVKQI